MFKSFLILLILTGLTAVLTVPWLGLPEVYEVSEAREGVVIHEMRHTHELLLPFRHGNIVPSKPPLFHWIAYLTSLPKGEFGEFDLRLPSALACIGMVLVSSLIGSRLLSLRAGFFTGILLLTTYSFLKSGQNGRVDMTFSFFVIAAVCRWFHAVIKRDDNIGRPPFRDASTFVYVQLGLLSGLAVLTKGPLGLVLPVFIVGLSAFSLWGFKGLFSTLRVGWLSAILVALPWYIAAYLKGNQDFIVRQLLFENVQRYLGAEGITAKPTWFYLYNFWSYALPWSIVLPFFLWKRLKVGLEISSVQAENAESEKKRSERYRAVEKLGLLWLLGLIVLFSLAVGKRVSYLLPALPALSLVLASWIDWYWLPISERLRKGNFPRTPLVGYFFWTLTILLSAIALITAKICCSRLEPGLGSARQTLAALSETFSRHQVAIGPWFSLFAILSLILWYIGWKRKNLTLLAGGAFFYIELAAVVLANILTIAKSETHSYKNLAAQISTKISADESLVFLKEARDESFDGLFFYLARRVKLQNPDVPPTTAGKYLARESWYEAQAPAFREGTRQILRGQRLRKPEQTRVVLFEVLPTPAPVSPPPEAEPPLGSPLQTPPQTPDLPSSSLHSPSPSPEAPLRESHNSIVPPAESFEDQRQESGNHLQTQNEPTLPTRESHSDSSPTPGI